MPALDDIRKQHPEYQDMPDAQLADSLHQKFYNDMPREEFDKKLGLGAAAPPPQMGRAERFKTGMVDPVLGAAQLAARMPSSEPAMAGPTPDIETSPEGRAKAVDQYVQGREEEIKKRVPPERADWYRLAGEASNPLPYLGAAVGGVPGLIAGGVLTGLSNPVTSGKDFAAEKTKDVLFNTAFSGLGGAATKALGWGVAPTVKEAAKYLMSKGITLTPGQIAGGIVRRAEEAAKSFPILGTFIRGAEGRSMESFNRSAIDQALAPIGERLPEGAKIGHDSVNYAKLRLDDAYSTLLPKMNFSMDSEFASSMSNIRLAASELPRQQADQFDKIIENRLAHRFIDTGTIPGTELKKIESDLNSRAATYRASSDGAQRDMAHLLDDVRFAVRDALTRQNPDHAAQLQKINSSYAMFTRLESAAARRASGQGVFTPGDLLQSIKSADKSVRKGTFARGDALMQDYAEFADGVLGNKLPDSGTTERAMWDMLGLSTGLVRPEIPAALGAASLPYTKVGQTAVNKLADPGAKRAAVRQGLQKAAPYLGTLLSNVRNRQQ